jgi:hypothetical protein
MNSILSRTLSKKDKKYESVIDYYFEDIFLSFVYDYEFEISRFIEFTNQTQLLGKRLFYALTNNNQRMSREEFVKGMYKLYFPDDKLPQIIFNMFKFEAESELICSNDILFLLSLMGYKTAKLKKDIPLTYDAFCEFPEIIDFIYDVIRRSMPSIDFVLIYYMNIRPRIKQNESLEFQLNSTMTNITPIQYISQRNVSQYYLDNTELLETENNIKINLPVLRARRSFSEESDSFAVQANNIFFKEDGVIDCTEVSFEHKLISDFEGPLMKISKQKYTKELYIKIRGRNLIYVNPKNTNQFIKIKYILNERVTKLELDGIYVIKNKKYYPFSIHLRKKVLQFLCLSELSRDHWLCNIRKNLNLKNIKVYYNIIPIPNTRSVAIDNLTKTNVLMTSLRKSDLSSAEYQTLISKVEASMLCKSEGVLKTLDCIEDGEFIYIIQESVRTSLEDAALHNEYDETSIKSLVIQLINIVEYLSSLKITISNLGPRNICFKNKRLIAIDLLSIEKVNISFPSAYVFDSRLFIENLFNIICIVLFKCNIRSVEYNINDSYSEKFKNFFQMLKNNSVELKNTRQLYQNEWLSC